MRARSASIVEAWPQVVFHTWYTTDPDADRDTPHQVDESLAQLRSGGKPLSPPFAWTNSLREHLHEMLRAFEAWSVNEYG